MKNIKTIDINEYEKVIQYIIDCNEFHDFRIGGFDYDSQERKAKIFVEEPDYGKKYAHDDVINTFVFELNEIEKFCFNTDLVLRPYILEFNETGDKELTIALANGNITFKAKKIKLTVPEQIKNQ